MSSTRKAQDDSVFHPNRFASSSQFERGMNANLVAKRANILNDQSDRELLWYLHHLSWKPGGLAAIAGELLAKYSDRIQTRAMADASLKPDMVCTVEQAAKLWKSMPGDDEAISQLKRSRLHAQAKASRALSQPGDEAPDTRATAVKFPAARFFEACRQHAATGLETYLYQLATDPALELADGHPWYFPTLTSTLREHREAYEGAQRRGLVITEVGRQVFETLKKTFVTKGFYILEGESRLGKSFAAAAWCEQHAGFARLVEVAPGNDDASFFRGLARGLGLGNFQQYKVNDVRERVESVLLTGQILLVLDEAQRCWPQCNMRYAQPKRITWLMGMVNKRVPIALIATPQFMELQRLSAEKDRWNSRQLNGRWNKYVRLPEKLSDDDLLAVAKAVFPGVESDLVQFIADYTSLSPDRYLGVIKSISEEARYLASEAGRDEVTTVDVVKALDEAKFTDANLVRVLEESTRKPRRIVTTAAPASRPPVPAVADRDDVITLPGQRGGLGLPADRRRAGDMMALTQD